MKLWIYCDNCKATQPMHGNQEHIQIPGDWEDLCCAVCNYVVATISAGDDEGNRPPSAVK